jgi:hypothetical protein
VRLSCLVPLVAAALTACSQAAPPATPQAAPASAEESAPPESKHRLSPDVSVAADELFTYIENNLLTSNLTGDGRAPYVAEARRQLVDLEALNETYEDRMVTRLLAMLISRDDRRAEMLASRGPKGEIASLVEYRDHCYSELMGWLEYEEATTSSLKLRQCLREAHKAATTLGLKENASLR